jgi:indole-3-glycerol phosphate synthase
MSDILDQIIAHKKEELKTLKAVSPANIKPSTRDFGHFIATQKKEVAVIAEIKRATPFRGSLTQEPIDAASLALSYEDNGAAAISVLTDPHFFKGSLKDLEEVSEKVTLPVLRKDFIIDIRQIYEARYFGADAILLIARCLTKNQLQEFLEACQQIHMRAFVEVHQERELEKALEAKATIIGINNRNLTDGSVDLKTTFDLVCKIPKDKIIVSESGIQSTQDIQKLKGKVDAVLVGTHLITSKNPQRALKDLVEAGEDA